MKVRRDIGPDPSWLARNVSMTFIGPPQRGRGPPAAKNEQAAGERIGAQFFPAQLRQSIDALPQVDGLDGYQYAHLRRDLNHADSHSTRLSPAKSGVVLPFHWMRILPRGPSNSMTHSAPLPVPGVSNSINAAGGAPSLRFPGRPDAILSRAA